MKTTTIFDEIHYCPCCGAGFTMADHKPSYTPQHGDFAICAKCAEILRYEIMGNKISLRILNDGDLKEIREQEGLYAEIMSLQAMIRSGNHSYKTI